MVYIDTVLGLRREYVLLVYTSILDTCQIIQ
jgi:hypothetical protein